MSVLVLIPLPGTSSWGTPLRKQSELSDVSCCGDCMLSILCEPNTLRTMSA